MKYICKYLTNYGTMIDTMHICPVIFVIYNVSNIYVNVSTNIKKQYYMP